MIHPSPVCDRTELWGALALVVRDIAFGRQDRFHDREYEAQLNRASALSGVINTIAVWKTCYFERVQAALARKRFPVPEQIGQHLSTLQWTQVHLNGSYHFTDITLSRILRAGQSSGPECAGAQPPPECKSQDCVGAIGTVIWVGKRSENTDFRQGTAHRIIRIAPTQSWDLHTAFSLICHTIRM